RVPRPALGLRRAGQVGGPARAAQAGRAAGRSRVLRPLPGGAGPGIPRESRGGRAAPADDARAVLVRGALRARGAPEDPAGELLMEPLSPWTYGRRNVRKILPTVIILTFVVVLVIVILSTIAGLKDSSLVYTREFDHWTIAFPKKDTRVPKELIAEIAQHPSVERVIDSRNGFVRVKTLIGPIPFNLRAARLEELEFLMKRADARLKEGTLPRPGT